MSKHRYELADGRVWHVLAHSRSDDAPGACERRAVCAEGDLLAIGYDETARDLFKHGTEAAVRAWREANVRSLSHVPTHLREPALSESSFACAFFPATAETLVALNEALSSNKAGPVLPFSRGAAA